MPQTLQILTPRTTPPPHALTPARPIIKKFHNQTQLIPRNPINPKETPQNKFGFDWLPSGFDLGSIWLPSRPHPPRPNPIRYNELDPINRRSLLDSAIL